MSDYRPDFKKFSAAVARWIEIQNILDDRYKVEVRDRIDKMGDYSENNKRYWSNYYYQLNLTETYPLRREQDSLFNGLLFERYAFETYLKYPLERRYNREDWRKHIPKWVWTTFELWEE